MGHFLQLLVGGGNGRRLKPKAPRLRQAHSEGPFLGPQAYGRLPWNLDQRRRGPKHSHSHRDGMGDLEAVPLAQKIETIKIGTEPRIAEAYLHSRAAQTQVDSSPNRKHLFAPTCNLGRK